MRDPNFQIVLGFGIIIAYFTGNTDITSASFYFIAFFPLLILLAWISHRVNRIAKSDPSYGGKSWKDKVSLKTLFLGFLLFVGTLILMSVLLGVLLVTALSSI